MTNSYYVQGIILKTLPSGRKVMFKTEKRLLLKKESDCELTLLELRAVSDKIIIIQESIKEA